jgi:hypothetical protein
MSINYVHCVPKAEETKHDTNFFSDCFCDPQFLPVDGGFIMVHRDKASIALGLHAIYLSIRNNHWRTWEEVNEGPVRV